MNSGATFEAKGDQALKQKTFFGFAASGRFEEAGELFTKAGNAYRLSDQYQESGDVYVKAAIAFKSTDSPNDYVNAYVEAGNSYKKVNAEAAVESFNTAIQASCDSGRISKAARYMKEVAEIMEADNNPEGAATAFEKAADLYMKDSKKSNANTCLLKVANLVSDMDHFTRAAGIYEQIGKDSLATKLGSFAAKGNFFSCLLCLLAAGDNVSVVSGRKCMLYAVFSWLLNIFFIYILYGVFSVSLRCVCVVYVLLCVWYNLCIMFMSNGRIVSFKILRMLTSASQPAGNVN